jgi:hypothetical protein
LSPVRRGGRGDSIGRKLADASALAIRALLRPLAAQGRLQPGAPPAGQRRLVLLVLDGLSHARLRAALSAGLLPALARRLDGGQLELSSFRAGCPATTAAFQAGLFYGAARRRGPDAPGALRALAGMDRAIGAILSAVEAALELGYDVYLLSGHGNVATRPFEQLTGISFAELVSRAERGAPLPRHPLPMRSGRGFAGGWAPGERGGRLPRRAARPP